MKFKSILLSFFGVTLSISLFAQNTFPTSGFAGINTTTPNHHLQIHGTTDYITPSYTPFPGGPTFPGVNLGVASRFSLTNTTTGSGVTSGGLIMQVENNLSIQNHASGNLTLNGGGVALSFNNQRAYMGETASSMSSLAYLNIRRHNDNGLRVRSTGTGKYGILSIANENESALLVSDVTDPIADNYNFKVTGGGEVFARKYITTLNPFPDYVFSEDYELMSYQDLRNYIYTNKHLPNIPKATTVEEKGMDLGELNRILVEKVEELTLYILELEDRLSEIEKEESSTNAEENTLVERINKLEALIDKLNK